MTQPLGTYSFLPWLRSGLANQIASADLDSSVKTRAKITVSLELAGHPLSGSGPSTAPVSRDIALFGPGDIQGIESRAIVRTEPRHWITNFEPNYLPVVEFYDEDFPWRYTPAAPDMVRGRLRPWIMLAVLREDEFTDGKSMAGKPLPYIDIPDLSVLPPADQLWAWAHVHVNRTLAGSDGEFVSNDMNAVLPRLKAVLEENPDLACSRIVCPRKLQENTAYHAFVIPVFEPGRLAGLGLDPSAAPHATFSAWDSGGSRPAPTQFPYYYRWFFRTASAGDFETLVRLLKPKPVDKNVGRRDLDVLAPGSNVRGFDEPSFAGVLKLGGALKVPRENYTPAELAEIDRYENWATPFPRPIQEDLAKLVNLGDSYADQPAQAVNAASGLGSGVEDDPDPLVTPPLYGTWHALTRRLLEERNGSPVTPSDNWVHQLNLDPRHRVSAGFGTGVVQQNQERYMEAAWQQVGDVLEANRRIRWAHLAAAVSQAWYDHHLQPLASVNHERSLALMAPLATRVLASPTTVHHVLSQSRVQPTLVSSALRRVIRPRGRLMKALPFSSELPASTLLMRVNQGEVSAAPPRVPPSGTTTLEQVAESARPRGVPAWLLALLTKHAWLRWLPLGLAMLLAMILLLLLPLAVALPIAALLVGGGAAFALLAERWRGEADRVQAIDPAAQTWASVAALPKSSDFHWVTDAQIEAGHSLTPALGGEVDSPDAARFKQALGEGFALMQASTSVGIPPHRGAVDLRYLSGRMLTELHPARTIARRTAAGIVWPGRILGELTALPLFPETFVEAMAYPVIDQPMYKPLTDLSAEMFLPNLNLIEQNSITLLETNQAFIEAYMAGLNHEMARELLWREYPTDQRGSPFRQFWDVSSFFDPAHPAEEPLKEKLRDIPPLHRWSKTSKLGDHDARERPGDKEEEVVLTIRGELLKRYPTAVIYAHRAEWQRKPDGSIDKTKERRPVELTAAEEANPPREKLRTPLYEAKVDPDLYFFGFDLTVPMAQGGTGENPTDDPGWFFVIKERPGEPRFGLDTDPQPKLHVWNDLSWSNVQPGPPGSFIRIDASTPTFALVTPSSPADVEKVPQHNDDKNVSWNRDMSSAEVAYVLFQAPVLVAVHASEMLAKR